MFASKHALGQIQAAWHRNASRLLHSRRRHGGRRVRARRISQHEHCLVWLQPYNGLCQGTEPFTLKLLHTECCFCAREFCTKVDTFQMVVGSEGVKSLHFYTFFILDPWGRGLVPEKRGFDCQCRHSPVSRHKNAR